MNRLSTPCCGDCSACKLLANGEVEMVTCVLDQLFRKVQKLESVIEGKKGVTLAGESARKKSPSATVKTEEDVQEND